jgi:endonuclease-3
MTRRPPRPRAAAAAPKPAARKAAARKAVAKSSAKPAVRGKRKAPRIRDLRAHADEVLRRLEATYPDAKCALDYRTPLELLVATILSAQCTDKRVNMVTPALFEAYPTAQSLAGAPRERIEELIKSTGFFRNKAKSIAGMARALEDRHGGQVPSSMEELVKLPGVGRKTANVVLGNAFHRNEGIVVDTHVGRVSLRLGLTSQTDPVKVEQDLMPLFPREKWTQLAHLLIDHGRAICDARAPRCGICPLRDICPAARVEPLTAAPASPSA